MSDGFTEPLARDNGKAFTPLHGAVYLIEDEDRPLIAMWLRNRGWFSIDGCGDPTNALNGSSFMHVVQRLTRLETWRAKN